MDNQMRDTVTDKELLERIAQHDEKALEQLHQRYYRRLCDFAQRIVKSPSLTEEVVSDVFLQLWLKRSTLVIRTKLKAYLFTAVRNQALNLHKKESSNWEDIGSLELAHLSTATDHLEYHELQQEVELLLGTLPNQRRLIFRLNRFEGLKYQEIADLLGISTHTVQNQMVAAIKQLASQYPRMSSRWASAFSLLFALFP